MVPWRGRNYGKKTAIHKVKIIVDDSLSGKRERQDDESDQW
jgi:hypothetical protein